MSEPLERYLRSVRRRLWLISPGERLAIVAELRDHLTAAAGEMGGVTDTNLTTAVARATPPAAVAAAYREIYPVTWPVRLAVALFVLFCAVFSGLPAEDPQTAVGLVGFFTLLYLVALVWLSLRSGIRLAVTLALAGALLRLLVTLASLNQGVYDDTSPGFFLLSHLLVSLGALLLAWLPGHLKARSVNE